MQGIRSPFPKDVIVSLMLLECFSLIGRIGRHFAFCGTGPTSSVSIDSK